MDNRTLTTEINRLRATTDSEAAKAVLDELLRFVNAPVKATEKKPKYYFKRGC